MSGKNLVLMGFRGTGKSVAGALLAARMHRTFVDTDTLVERHCAAPVEQVFAKKGEPFFRRIEREVIVALDPEAGAVIALGGGAVMDDHVQRFVPTLGPVAWLTATSQVIAQRIKGSARPSLTGKPLQEEVSTLLARRRATYEMLATWQVDTSTIAPEEVAHELEQLWRGPDSHDLR